MKNVALQINELLGWSWILLGFATGSVIGLFFHRENWLGGYSSLRRRMYRLGHISFFGLGVLNLMFYLTFATAAPHAGVLIAASRLLAAGAVTMPLCCLLMAHFPKTHLAFGFPVSCLLAGATLTLYELVTL